MLNYQVSMSLFLDQMRSMISSIVVKKSIDAALNETLESKKNASRYMSIIYGNNEWSSFGVFDKEVMETAGISKYIIDNVLYTKNNDLIPYENRELCMKLEIEYITSNYTELNNYYRTLNGLPTIEDVANNDFVLIGENTLEVDPSTPIHLLSVTDLDYYNASSMRTEFIAKYPTKKYLNFLGSRSIDIYKARDAKNYEILYMEDTKNKIISKFFRRNYAAARDYIMRGLYNNEDRKIYRDYDGFMGLVIITMAITKTFSDIFKQGITRDFFDDNLLRLLFTNYNIPYEESVPLKYQKLIAKQLNVLLQKKSSNDVLYDIINIFTYAKINIYAFYLVKDYKKDSLGDPIIVKKKIIDDYGNEKEVIDYENTYNIYFQRVNIRNKNPMVDITNPSNKVEYSMLTHSDPYWVNDSDLLNKIYQNKYNNIITKYLSLEVMFDLSKVLYEAGHGFRVVLDRHKDTKKLMLDLPYVQEPVSLFDTIIFLNALICKKFNLTGEIPLDPRQIATIYGFNFKADLDAIRTQIEKDKEEVYRYYREYKDIDEKIFDFLLYKKINTIQDLDELFENIDGLRSFLDRNMRLTTDLRTYEAYKKLYKALLITKDLKELYIMKDNKTQALTYDILLEDRRPDIWQFLHTLPDNEIIDYEKGNGLEVKNNEELNEVIDVVLDGLDDIHESLVDLRYLNNKSNIIGNIEKIINQMKSYTVDIAEYGLYYILRDPHMCLLKVLDDVSVINDMLYKGKISVLDIISEIESNPIHKEKINLSKIYFYIYRLITIKLHLHLDSILKNFDSNLCFKDKNKYYTIINSNDKSISLSTKSKIKDRLKITYEGD